jgi:hypothetical protein
MPTTAANTWHDEQAIVKEFAVEDCEERLMLRPIVPVEHPMRHALRKAQVQDALRIPRLGSDLVVFLLSSMSEVS